MFSVILQTVINLIMMSIGGQGNVVAGRGQGKLPP